MLCKLGQIMSELFAEKIFILFAILAGGSWLGRLSWRGLSLGSAGVLFVALIFGHFGYQIPKEVMEIGLLLFVYAVGLQAGPRFFRTFRRHGLQYVVIALAIGLGGALAVILLALALELPGTLAAGMYTGALTCTPALAGAIDAANRLLPADTIASISVGYGIAYPFSMVGVVLLIQFLPKLLRRNTSEEARQWEVERGVESPDLIARQFRITNPNVHGLKVREVNPRRMTVANISRIKHGDQVFAASADSMLHLDDVVMVVGAEDELEKMRLLLGEECSERMDVNSDVLSLDVEVYQEAMTGKSLGQMRLWERWTVVITRVRRQGVEITPTGATTLEMGDYIRVVGGKEAVEAFAREVHGEPRKADETNMVPFLAGLLLGITLGAIPIQLSNGIELRLGSAGGAFVVSLLVGHFGGIGPLRLHVPAAAKNLTRELGLMLFLAGAGANAGGSFLSTLQAQGPILVLAGAVITISAVTAGLLSMHLIYRMNVLATMGALTAGMTNPPALGAANGQTDSELPTLAYASVYPVALIFKIIIAQLLVHFFMRF